MARDLDAQLRKVLGLSLSQLVWTAAGCMAVLVCLLLVVLLVVLAARYAPAKPESEAEETGPAKRITKQWAAEIAREYFAERNRRFLARLDSQRGSFNKLDIMIGPKRLWFGDDRKCLSLDVGRAGYVKGVRVIQILDAETMLVSTEGTTVLAVGWGTASVVDDQKVWPTDAIVITGTTEYTSVLGAKKRVYVIQPFDLRQYEDDYVPQIPDEIRDIVGHDVAVGDGHQGL